MNEWTLPTLFLNMIICWFQVPFLKMYLTLQLWYFPWILLFLKSLLWHFIFSFSLILKFFPDLCFDLFFSYLLVEHVLIHFYVFESCHFLHLLPSLFHCIQIIFYDGFTYLKFIETCFITQHTVCPSNYSMCTWEQLSLLVLDTDSLMSIRSSWFDIVWAFYFQSRCSVHFGK